MGTHEFLLAASKTTGAGNYSFLFIIIIIFGLMYFLLIRPQRNRQRQAQQQQQQVGVGARVRTTAGIYGTVVSADGDDVMLEIAPGVQIKMMRRAIMNVVPDDEPGGMSPTFSDGSASDGSSSSESHEDFKI